MKFLQFFTKICGNSTKVNWIFFLYYKKLLVKYSMEYWIQYINNLKYQTKKASLKSKKSGSKFLPPSTH